MFLKSLPTIALISLLATPPCHAQAGNEKPTSKTGIGSAVLRIGEDQKNLENGVYTYENIIDIPGVSQTILYDRAKKWIMANLKISQESIFFDDANKASITANTAVRIKDNLRLTSQMIEFKLSISFKDGKTRVQGNDFIYRSIYPGAIYQKPFNDLRPFAKNLKRTIYEEFDLQFEELQKDLSSAIKDDKVDNW